MGRSALFARPHRADYHSRSPSLAGRPQTFQLSSSLLALRSDLATSLLMARVARTFVSIAQRQRDFDHAPRLTATRPAPTDWILADKFPLTAGAVSFNLPKNLAARDDYIVVLFGDSGNASPHFSIKAASVQKRGSPKNRLDVL